MPTYDYQCPQCGVFEIEQRISEEVLKVCPRCKENGVKSKVERLLSAPALSFKGSGFYITDYNKSPASGAPSAPTSTETKTENQTPKPVETSAKSKPTKE